MNYVIQWSRSIHAHKEIWLKGAKAIEKSLNGELAPTALRRRKPKPRLKPKFGKIKFAGRPGASGKIFKIHRGAKGRPKRPGRGRQLFPARRVCRLGTGEASHCFWARRLASRGRPSWPPGACRLAAKCLACLGPLALKPSGSLDSPAREILGLAKPHRAREAPGFLGHPIRQAPGLASPFGLARSPFSRDSPAREIPGVAKPPSGSRGSLIP
jgi:hypothetical protein